FNTPPPPPSRAGPCDAVFDRFFYNVRSGKCEQFVYGGCGGNSNNFETLEKCQRRCEMPQQQ
uniref:BPTI/Kunitz inhibitor domain-containing protein n=1 Tax=Sphenodon punctatus TaxID=8508 RepID=A0A8D0HW17_SPHPU